jgi:hypothetical protein
LSAHARDLREQDGGAEEVGQAISEFSREFSTNEIAPKTKCRALVTPLTGKLLSRRKKPILNDIIIYFPV